MKIKELYSDDEKITIKSYLKKCGVKDVDKYIKCNTLEDNNNYENIEKFKKVVMSFVK